MVIVSIITLGFNISSEVSALVDFKSHVKQTAKMLKQRKHYFDRCRLFEFYAERDIPNTDHEIDQKAYDEIVEIECAVNMMFGYPDD